MKTAIKEKLDIVETNGHDSMDKTTSTQKKQFERAHYELLVKSHELTTRKGILEWMAAVALALTHDLPEMPRQKANTSAYVASVSLKAIQS